MVLSAVVSIEDCAKKTVLKTNTLQQNLKKWVEKVQTQKLFQTKQTTGGVFAHTYQLLQF